MSGVKLYNYCLDYIKGTACVFVVFMHCEFPGLLGIVVQTVSRYCVPLFFMVSGYFCYKGLISRSNPTRKIKHIAKITLYACIFYFCFFLLSQYFSGGIDLSTNFQKILILLFFNQPFWVAGQYWFFFALLYSYVLFFVLELSGKKSWGYRLAASMFVAYILLAQGFHVVGIYIPNFIYRNWLVEGFAFFMLGHWIHENQSRIQVSNNILIATIIISTILCLLERFLLGRDFGVNICTIPQVTALFLYAIKNPTRHQGYMQLLGKDCSMFVYILHPVVWHTIEKVYQYENIDGNMTALYLMPVIVLCLTILLSITFYRFQTQFTHSKRNV